MQALTSIYNTEPMRVARVSSYLCGILLLIAGILQIAALFLRAGQSSPNGRSEWDAEYLTAVWTARNSLVSVDLFVDAFVGLAYATLLYTVYILRVMYKGEKGFARHFMLYAFAGAVALNVIGFLQGLGVEIYCRAASSSILKNPDSYPVHVLVALTAAYNAVRASSWFLFGCDTLLFFVAFLMTFLLARASQADDAHRLSVSHAYLGLANACVCLFLFFYEIVAAASMSWSSGVSITFAIFYLIFNVILLPGWVFWLGYQLGTKSLPEGRGEARGLLAKPSQDQ